MSFTSRIRGATAQLSDIADLIDTGSVIWGGTSAGSANAQTITPSPTLTAYVTGMKFVFIAGYTNTATAPTLNVNSLGAKTMRGYAGSTLQIGHILAGNTYLGVYDGTYIQIANPSAILNSWAAPALTANSGSISVSAYDYSKYKYDSVSKLVSCILKATYTVTSGTPTAINGTLPITATSSNAGIVWGTHDIGGSVSDAIIGSLTSTTTFATARPSLASLEGSGTHYIYLRIDYEAA
jgi:hypothetical protein